MIRDIRTILPAKILCVELKELEYREPFDSDADAKMTIMYGEGLEKAQVRKPAAFIIEARNKAGERIRMGGHPFKLRVERPGGRDPRTQKIEDRGDGTFLATYVAEEPGLHIIHVTLDGENVARSPIQINVTSAPPDARMTVMYGPGLESAKVNETASFVVEARDAEGNVIESGGHPFKLRVQGPTPDADPQIQSLVDNNNGKYDGKYVPTQRGRHIVTVTLYGEEVARCPYYVEAEDKDPKLLELLSVLEAIKKEIGKDQRRMGRLGDISKKLDKVVLKDPSVKPVALDVKEYDIPRLSDFIRDIDVVKYAVAEKTFFDKNTSPAEKVKLLTPMVTSMVKDLEDWAHDYKGVMDKINNLNPKNQGGKRQRIHLWVHRKGVAIPQHIMVTTNKPSTTTYRRHIRIDASKGFYDTHADPAGYLDGLLGLAGELNLQKIDSRDRYLTGGRDDELLEDSEEPSEEPFIMDDKQGRAVRPSRQPLLLEGALQTARGQSAYCFLYADVLAVTQMVNNGEKYILKSCLKFDQQSQVLSPYQGNERAFLVKGKGRERVYFAKSKSVALTWVSNLESVIRMAKAEY